MRKKSGMVTVKEAAEYFGCSIANIHKHIKTKGIPYEIRHVEIPSPQVRKVRYVDLDELRKAMGRDE